MVAQPLNGESRTSSSTAELVNQAASQISVLVRDELALARAEMVGKAKQAGVGAGLVSGAATLALYGLALVLALAVVLLDLVWPLWSALLLVCVVVFAAAAVTALAGRRQLAAVAPPVPTEALAGAEADVRAVKDAVREGRR
jgi:hypothetical protein